MAKYPVLKFNQYADPDGRDLLFMFAAPARAIAAWAGVPRKGWHIRMLFQRGLEPHRIREVKKFWNLAATFDPLIGGFSRGPNAITITMDGMPAVSRGKIDLSPSPPLSGANDLENLRILAPRLLAKIIPRLEQWQADEVNAWDPRRDIPDVEDDYVYQFAFQLRQMADLGEKFVQIGQLTDQGLSELVMAMAAIERPAVVVDGQHRLIGAAEAGPEVMLPVVLVPNCTWIEQIFQFVVINRTAKNVKQDLLTDIVGSSLTPKERSNFGARLNKAGVRDTETMTAVTSAGRDAESPFRDMVQLSIEGTPPGEMKPFIRDRTIKQLIDGGDDTHGWRNDSQFLAAYVLPRFVDDFAWSGLSEGAWRPFWFAFWQEVADHFNAQAETAGIEPMWQRERQTNLTKGVALRMLQTLFIRKMVERAETFHRGKDLFRASLPENVRDEAIANAEKMVIAPPTSEEFRVIVKKEFLSPGVPLRFFTADWHASLDTKDAQRALFDEMDKAWKRMRSGGVWAVPKGGKVFK